MSLDAFAEREEIRRQIAAGTIEFPDASPFALCAEHPKVRILPGESLGAPDRWFFIGDIHGDFLALHSQLAFITKTQPDFRLVFLGDLADRGSDSAECFLLLLRRAMQYPGQIFWIAGNHDICFAEEDGKFVSSVEPAEFLDFLNGGPETERDQRQKIGRYFLHITGLLPRALIFPDGLLATHGGFPLVDLQKKIPANSPVEEIFASICQSEFLQDFTWTRLTRYKRKIPNRDRKGCSYGFEDFSDFCRLFPASRPVRRMITGHEHFDEGWMLHTTYLEHPVASLTGFGFPVLGGPATAENYRKFWFVARHRENDLPEPLEIQVPQHETELFFPCLQPLQTGDEQKKQSDH